MRDPEAPGERQVQIVQTRPPPAWRPDQGRPPTMRAVQWSRSTVRLWFAPTNSKVWPGSRSAPAPRTASHRKPGLSSSSRSRQVVTGAGGPRRHPLLRAAAPRTLLSSTRPPTPPATATWKRCTASWRRSPTSQNALAATGPPFSAGFRPPRSGSATCGRTLPMGTQPRPAPGRAGRLVRRQVLCLAACVGVVSFSPRSVFPQAGPASGSPGMKTGAGDGIRTRDVQLGKSLDPYFPST